MEDSVPGIVLSQLVDEYMIASFNDKRAYYLNFLYHAKIAWRDLFWNTIFRVKKVSMPVIYDGDEIYIKKPSGCVRLLSLSVTDDCGYHPLLLDATVPTDKMVMPVSKSCQKCNTSLCSVIDSNITTRTETFGGVDYILKTYYNTLATGEVYKHEEQLTFDEETSTVKKEVVKILACEVDMLPCGCPKPSTQNVKKLVERCGCIVDYTCKDPVLKSQYGYFNHKFEGNKIYLRAGDTFKDGKKLPDRIDVSFQISTTDGVDEEVVVPEYAINTMFTGIAYYSTLFKPNTDSRLSKVVYDGSKEKLLEFMYPLDLDAFRALQGILPKWG